VFIFGGPGATQLNVPMKFIHEPIGIKINLKDENQITLHQIKCGYLVYFSRDSWNLAMLTGSIRPQKEPVGALNFWQNLESYKVIKL